MIGLRAPPELRAEIETWAASQDDKPGLSEAIRRLVEQALSTAQPRPGGAHKGAAKAKAIAGEQVERLIDPATPVEERQQRKRRLLKGPSAFREMRTDLPKAKRS